MALIIALTGGIGSGKSTTALKFSKIGVKIIDTDIISRQIVMPGTFALKNIIDYFGNSILNNDGSLNRRLLRKKIFTHPNKRKWLDNFLHPIIYRESKKQIKKNNNLPYILWIVPLIIEKKMYREVDRVLVIDTKLETQIQRTMIRDNISREQVKEILNVQVTREKRLSIANDIIENNGTKDDIVFDVSRLHKKYLTLAK